MRPVAVQPYADSHNSHNGFHFRYRETFLSVNLDVLTDIADGVGYFMLQIL